MRFHTSALRLLIPAWVAVMTAIRVGVDPETDVYWTAREGLALLDGSTLVHADRWGWTPLAGDFVPNSPAWEYLLGGAWRIGGWFGLMTVAALGIAGSLAILAMLAHHLGAARLVTTSAMLALVLLTGGLFTNRAAMPAFALFLATLAVLARTAAEQSLRWWTPIRVAIGTCFAAVTGMWLHNSWTLWGLLVPVGLVWFLIWRPEVSSRLRCAIAAGGAVGSLTGAFAGPLGVRAWQQATAVATICRNLIVEWSPAWSLGGYWRALWPALLIGCGWLLAQELRRGVRAHQGPLRVLLAAGSLVGAIGGVYASRFSMLAMASAMPLVAARGTEAMRQERWRKRRLRVGERGTAGYWEIVAVLLLPVLAVFACAALLHSYPALREPAYGALPHACHLFADDTISGPAILLRPDVRVWTDGRQDLYGRARIAQAIEIMAGQSTSGAVPSGTTCVLTRQSATRSGLEQRLEESGRWTGEVVPGGSLRLWLPVPT